jgi:hypothetical protein
VERGISSRGAPVENDCFGRHVSPNVENRLRPVLLSALVLMAIYGCTADAVSSPEDVEIAGIPEAHMVLTYPAGWHLADGNLTPNLADPREVFSLGSFPLRVGGPHCAQVPSQALHDLETTDVFLTLQERGADAIASGFDPRPHKFGPTSGSTDNEVYDCVEPDERDDIGKIHWIWFTDQDRYFHVLVALGREAAPENVSAAWGVLDQLVIEPKS